MKVRFEDHLRRVSGDVHPSCRGHHADGALDGVIRQHPDKQPRPTVGHVDPRPVVLIGPIPRYTPPDASVTVAAHWESHPQMCRRVAARPQLILLHDG